MPDVLGVLDGMRPLATADFLRKLVEKTDAACDQDHIPVLLYGDCTTPDRTANIDGPLPLPQLLDGIRFLKRAGAVAIAIFCNSAHRWYTEMRAASEVAVLHIVEASALQASCKNAGARRIGVLSTYGTHRMGMYRETLAGLDCAVVTPTDSEFEALISPSIAINKANRWDEAGPLYDEAADNLFAREAEVIVWGCTEIPVGMARRQSADPGRFVDSNNALVDVVIGHVTAARVVSR